MNEPSSDAQDSGSGSSQRWRRDRPEHFSTYVPRDLVRRLKVIAAIRDVPLWTVITDALEQHLRQHEREHGKLPDLRMRGGAAERG